MNIFLVIHNNCANRNGLLYQAMDHSNFCPINFRWSDRVRWWW